MRAGVPISILAHAGLISAGIWVLPQRMPDALDDAPVIPVELVMVAEETDLRQAILEPEPVREEETLVPEKLLPVEEELKQIVPPEPELPPDPTPEIVPAPEKVEAATKPEPEPEPEPELQIAKADIPKPEKANPKPRPPEFDLDRLRQKLEEKTGPTPDAEQELAPQTGALNAVGRGEKLTADERAILQARLYECWQAPLATPDPQKLRVLIKFRLNPDGSIIGRPIVLNKKEIESSGDSYWGMARHSALQAVAECFPYQLPPEKYDDWKEITMNFNVADANRNSR